MFIEILFNIFKGGVLIYAEHCILYLIGSQCNVDRTGLMWSYFLVLVRTLAAAF